MRVTTDERGQVQGELLSTERKTIARAATLVNEIAWYYRGTQLGKESEATVDYLQSLLSIHFPLPEVENKDTAPAAMKDQP